MASVGTYSDDSQRVELSTPRGWRRVSLAFRRGCLHNPFFATEIVQASRAGSIHGVRVVMMVAAISLAAILPALLPGGAGWSSASVAGSAGDLLAILTGLVAGTLPGLSISRERDAGILELFLLARRRPWEILGGKLAAGLLTGATLLAQLGLVLGIADLSFGMEPHAVARSLGLGAATLVIVLPAVIWYEVVMGTARPLRHLLRLGFGLAGGAVVVLATVSSAQRPAAGILAAAALMFAGACSALSSLAPEASELDEDTEALRRRLSKRTLTGRVVTRPVFQASRIPIHRTLVRPAAWTVLAVGGYLALHAPASRAAASALSTALCVYALLLAVSLAQQTAAINPQSSGFALIAATPLSTRTILLQRALGKASLLPDAFLPFLLLPASLQSRGEASLAGVPFLAALAALTWVATLVSRCRTGGVAPLLFDVVGFLILLTAAMDGIRRFTITWTGSSYETVDPRVTLVLIPAYLGAAWLGWRLALHRFESARRRVE